MKKCFNLWVAGTLLLYYFGSIPWSGQNSPKVLIMVITCLLFFNIGAAFGQRSEKVFWQAHQLDSLYNIKTALIILAIYATLFTIHLQMVSGRFLLNPASWSLDFGEVYTGYLKTVTTRTANSVLTNIFLIIKALLFPLFIFIFFKYYKEKPSLAFTVLFFFIASSFMRGTDKESIDAAILFLIVSYYYGDIKKVFFLGAIFSPLLIYLFVDRKLGRFGGNYPNCLPNSDTCFDYTSYWSETFGPSFEVGRVMLTNYITQGYEGLYLAMSLKFDFNFGIGHLAPLKNAICSITGLTCDLNNYNTKLLEVGWNTEYRWTSAYTSLANDFHWVFVPVYFLLIGYIFSIAENTWKKDKTPAALVCISLTSLLFLYSSANMQIAASMDWVFTTILFMYIPIIQMFISRKTLPPLQPDTH